MKKVRYSVLNTSVSTDVAIAFFTSSAKASSVAQPSVSFFANNIYLTNPYFCVSNTIWAIVNNTVLDVKLKYTFD